MFLRIRANICLRDLDMFHSVTLHECLRALKEISVLARHRNTLNCANHSDESRGGLVGSFAPGERSDSIIWFISLLLEVFTWCSRCFCSFKAGSYFGVEPTSWPICAGICHTCAI